MTTIHHQIDIPIKAESHCRSHHRLELVSLMVTLLSLVSSSDNGALAQTYGRPATASAPAGGSNNEVPRQMAFIAPSAASDSLRLRDAAQGNYQAQQFQTAISLYRRIVQAQWADANDFYWLGESYAHAHLYSDAAQAFTRAITLNPSADNVRVRLAEAYLCAKQPEMAKQTCLSASTVVRDDYSKKQLNALMRVASLPAVTRKLKAPNANSKTGQLEQ